MYRVVMDTTENDPTITAHCVTGTDGYHTHEYRIRIHSFLRHIVTVHLHTWMDDHMANHPTASPVYVTTGGADHEVGHANLVDAIRTIPGRLPSTPAIDCTARDLVA